MELDDLKAYWRKETELNINQNKKSMEQLQLIFRSKTFDMHDYMKRKHEKIITLMLISMTINLAFLLSISGGLKDPGSANGFIKSVFFYLVLIGFYWLRFINLNKMQLSEHIKDRLQQMIDKYKKSLKTEVAFVGLFFFFIFSAGRFILGKGLQDIGKPEVIAGIPLIILFTGVMIYLIYKRYKGKIKELEGYLEEYDKGPR